MTPGPGARAGPCEGLPLTPSQETLWEYMKAFAPEDPGDARINFLGLRRVTGHLDQQVFRRAVADVVRRQPSLRTVFLTVDHDPLVMIEPEIDPPVRFADVSSMPEDARREWLDSFYARERFRSFDLRRGPLWEIHLIRTAERSHVLALSFSHIIFDGWSANVLVAGIVHAYRAHLGLAPHPAGPDIEYQDIVALQRRSLPGLPEDLDHWTGRLLPAPEGVPFPVLDPPRDADLMAETSHGFDFGAELAEKVAGVAWDLRAAPFTLLLAAYHILLSLRTGRERIIVGTTTMGRDTRASRHVVGQFTNNVYLAADIRPESPARDVVTQVHSAMESGLARLASFKATAAAVNPDFPKRRPWPFLHLYDAWFQALSPDGPGLVFPDLTVEYLEFDEGTPPPGTKTRDDDARVPLWIKRGTPALIIDNDRSGGALVHSPRFFDDHMVSEAARDYVSIVSALVRDPLRSVGSLHAPR
ncbi:condensation domain-containing protein [Sphaerisporangium sp. B11E5]|uniref:condensation domain-containing protein n=1 Tax=Sphaerisporangium sp. B11E5 TaxID=3153563 RepID=UPI00325C68A9